MKIQSLTFSLFNPTQRSQCLTHHFAMTPSLCHICRAITAEALVSDEGYNHVEAIEDLWKPGRDKCDLCSWFAANLFESKTPIKGKNFRLKAIPNFQEHEGNDGLSLLARSESIQRNPGEKPVVRLKRKGIPKGWQEISDLDIFTLSSEITHTLSLCTLQPLTTVFFSPR